MRSSTATVRMPDLIVGHGVLGRLLARIAQVLGAQPVVWERNAERAQGATGYRVLNPGDDTRRDYRCIFDVSGDPTILDSLIARLAPAGEIVLAASTTSRWRSRFRQPSCAKRGCASPHSGATGSRRRDTDGRVRSAFAGWTDHAPTAGERGSQRLPHGLQ